MKHVRFVIRNFKGIENVEINLGNENPLDVITLIGLNESGKTTILEAIALLGSSIKDSEAHKYIPKSKKSNFNAQVSVYAKYKWSDNDNFLLQTYAKTLGFASFDYINEHSLGMVIKFKNSNFEGKSRNYLINFKGRKIGSDKKVVIEHPSEDWKKLVRYIDKALVPQILYYPDFLFDFPEKIYIDDEGLANINNESYIEVIENILKLIDSQLNIKDHILNRIKDPMPSNIEALDETLNKMSAKVTDKVFSVWEKLFNSTFKEIIITYKVEMFTATPRYYLEFKLREGSSKFNINERSLGFKWFFTFLLFTEFRKYRRNNMNNVLFLLDEPASNLHSTAQKKLLSTFSDLVINSTLIYTTHSHHLINPEWLNGVYVVKNRKLDTDDDLGFLTNNTKVEALIYKQFVSKYPNQTDYFQPILDTLEFQPSYLEKIPNIIIVEGKYDYYTLKYFDKINFKDKYNNLYIYPGNGANSNKSIIKMYLAWGRDFIILLDGDQAGQKAKREYIKQYGVDIKDKIVTLLDIDSSYTSYMESLFDSNELIEITQKFDSKAKAYDKSKFNSSLQNMLYFNEKYVFKEETLKRFDKIFDFLAKKW
ncbi:hypothetical protein BWI97_08620 [Siphonobacter sp. BAB-5405]|uniref:ATP-dependent nuclease n=1 Tax=Siphonobacter sp. BAB-5405 TaxID=1864825 RepID=UPI000C810859|nr:AAA family ATPase [Siphonobacter sp. BAB-5405]PMD97663.1 hypothetical protein BWI97_08620 [Siphonobacter sp. BAB-5405]